MDGREVVGLGLVDHSVASWVHFCFCVRCVALLSVGHGLQLLKRGGRRANMAVDIVGRVACHELQV